MVEFSQKYQYCWIWKFLITWDRFGWWIGFYPDYETVSRQVVITRKGKVKLW